MSNLQDRRRFEWMVGKADNERSLSLVALFRFCR
jgi:hypothetical protein